MNVALIVVIILLLLLSAGIIAFFAIRSGKKNPLLKSLVPPLTPSLPLLYPLRTLHSVTGDKPAPLQYPLTGLTWMMRGLQDPLTGLKPGETAPVDLQYPLSGLQDPTIGLEYPLKNLQDPLTGLKPGETAPVDLQYPLTRLQDPLTRLQDPLTGLEYPLKGLGRIELPGCKVCSDNGGMQIIYCPSGVLPKSATRDIPKGTPVLVSNYRIKEYDPEKPDYVYKGQGFWFRQLSTNCKPEIEMPGCTLCSSDIGGNIIMYCPKGVLPASAARDVPQGTECLISNFRIPKYDSCHPDYVYKGQGFWFRQLANGCPK